MTVFDSFNISAMEVFAINLLVGTVTFFILSWVLGQIVKAHKFKIGLIWAATVILTPIISTGLITTYFCILFCESTEDFDRDKWFADKPKRYEMRDDILRSGMLIDKNKNEVVDLIGLPDYKTDSTNSWNYDLGMSAVGLGFQFNNLLVTFKNERVIKVEKQEIPD